MGHFVEFKWDGRDRSQIARGVRYISHREEGLEGGRTRTLIGIGPVYRALRGDETRIVEQLVRDGEGLRSPRYHRAKVTVDDATAKRLSHLPGEIQERVLRDAIEKTFRGTLRRAQGVFVVHAHGGRGRPHGHPHVHIRLSPLLDDGRRMVLTRGRLAEFKERWGNEVDRALTRAERGRGGSRGRSADVAPTRSRRSRAAGSARRPSRGFALLRVGTTRAGRIALRVCAPGVADLLRLRDQAQGLARDPGRALGRLALGVAVRALPAPLRAGVQVARILGRLRGD